MKRNTLVPGFIAVTAMVVMFGGIVRAEGVKGSIKVERGDMAAYSRIAKISPGDAVKSITSEYPKSYMKSVRLQKEEGYLVYEALFLDGEKEMDAKVDAGNGSILKTEKAETGGNDSEMDGKNDENDERENNAGAGKEEKQTGMPGVIKNTITVKENEEKDG